MDAQDRHAATDEPEPSANAEAVPPRTTRLRRALAALGETHRLRIVLLLLERPRSVGELVQDLRCPQPLVSHHLAVLQRAGFLAWERRGRLRLYSVEPGDDADRLALVALVSRARDGRPARDEREAGDARQAREPAAEDAPASGAPAERRARAAPASPHMEDWLL